MTHEFVLKKLLKKLTLITLLFLESIGARPLFWGLQSSESKNQLGDRIRNSPEDEHNQHSLGYLI